MTGLTSLTVPTALTADTARRHVAGRALGSTPVGRVGLELEFHVVDLRDPAAPVGWHQLSDVVRNPPVLPAGSRLTVEPGGQLELSTPPGPDVTSAVAALSRDLSALRTALAPRALGLASVGADPGRPPRRINPAPRYRAMEEHFRAVGCGQAGRSMMCSTAALQVNLEAGPAAQWPDRVSLMHRLGPVLVALAACSPMLDGRSTGWASTRQRVWGEIDQRRCGPLLSGQHPDAEWADYALSAPVMLLRDPRSGEAAPVLGRVSFDAWLTGESPLGGRRPTLADLDYHLTTLFPPVRPRGFLEIRYLDALPGAYWPALAAIVVTLLDDPRAAGVAAEACEPVEEAWTRAARHGLDDPVLRRAACRCVATAATYAPPALHDAVQRFAELVMDGRSPGGEFAERLRSVGPVRALREAADE